MAAGLSRARLAIPKVNQNPRPPRLGNAQPKLRQPDLTNRPTPQLAQAYARNNGNLQKQNQAATNAVTTAAQTAAVGAPGSTSAAAAAPVTPVAAAVPAPSTERFAIPSWTPAVAGEPDPRDASYWANLAKLKFTDEQQFNQANEEETKSSANYTYAVQQALAGRKVQERELGENAIKGNLGASGWLDRNQAEQTTDFTDKQAHESLGHEEELHAFNTARKALEQGYGIEAAEELAEAAGRYASARRAEAEEAEPDYAEEPGSPAAAASSSSSYTPGSSGNKNNTKKQGIANNQKAGAGNNKSGNSAISNNVAVGGKKKKG